MSKIEDIQKRAAGWQRQRLGLKDFHDEIEAALACFVKNEKPPTLYHLRAQVTTEISKLDEVLKIAERKIEEEKNKPLIILPGEF